jgi:hypothetical protein
MLVSGAAVAPVPVTGAKLVGAPLAGPPCAGNRMLYVMKRWLPGGSDEGDGSISW